jgi:hypothetical protein
MPNQPVTLTEMGLALIRIWKNIPQAFLIKDQYQNKIY